MKQTQVLARQEKGKHIAQTSRITRTEKGWKVPSESGNGFYLVVSDGREATCTCPDHETRRCKCKHLWAVEYIVTGQVDSEGNVTITKTERRTYRQAWSAYNRAQQEEKREFMRLLADLTAAIPAPAQHGRGRPSHPLGDMVYAMVFKTYSTFSGRRFTTDMATAKTQGYLAEQPHYNSVFDYFQKAALTPVLRDLVTLTSLPLQAVERDFTLDSTGFGTGQFQRWYSFKHGREISAERWVKCHFIAGVKTNTITAAEVTSEFENDAPKLPALVAQTAEHFEIREVSADKAYLSRNNLEAVHALGGAPFVPFKTNSQPNGNGMLWKKLYHYFQLHNDDFMEHYHKRSNAESTVQMVKSKFGDSVRSKKWASQVNEVLCKVIAHNICVVIQEMHEQGITPQFCPKNDLPARQIGSPP